MLSQAQWDDFSRDGYLRLGRVLDDAQVAALCARAYDLALGTVVNESVRLQLDTGGAYEALPEAVERLDGGGTIRYRTIQGLEADEVFWPLVSHPQSIAVCARAYGPHAAISIFRAMVMNKPAGQGTML